MRYVLLVFATIIALVMLVAAVVVIFTTRHMYPTPWYFWLANSSAPFLFLLFVGLSVRIIAYEHEKNQPQELI